MQSIPLPDRSTPVIREKGAGGPAAPDAGQQLRGDVQRRLVRVLREHDVAVPPRRVRHRCGEPRLQLRADTLMRIRAGLNE